MPPASTTPSSGLREPQTSPVPNVCPQLLPCLDHPFPGSHLLHCWLLLPDTGLWTTWQKQVPSMACLPHPTQPGSPRNRLLGLSPQGLELFRRKALVMVSAPEMCVPNLQAGDQKPELQASAHPMGEGVGQ